MNNENRRMDIKEVSNHLNLSRSSIYVLIKTGKLKAERHNLKGKFYFQRSDIENFKC
jgi:excisionase family DNA binding protein